MRGVVIEYWLNGHDIEYSRETDGRYVCRKCEATLLNALQFLTVECSPAEPGADR